MKKFNLVMGMLVSSMLVGCVSIPKADTTANENVKSLAAPNAGKAGMYIFGSKQAYDLWLNGKCLGVAGANGFFYEEVEGGKEHIISTDNMMIAGHLKITPQAGQFYYIDQYSKILSVYTLVNHVPVDLRELSASEGKKALAKATLIKQSACRRDAIKLP